MNKTITQTMGAVMKILHVFILLFLLFSFGCAGTFNFEFGSSLANFQDTKFKQYKKGKKFSKADRKRLKGNLWVRAATVSAPGNLPIRHYCLIDLDKGKARNKRNIQKQLDKLGSDIWREGYSYWQYTKPFLVEYDKKFKKFGSFVRKMDSQFSKTAYLGNNGKLYPAPYGDLRHVPLESNLQSGKPISANKEVYPLIIQMKSDHIEYFVQKCPLGFNTHVPDKTTTVRVSKDGSLVCVVDGKSCKQFKWYEGYDKKYKSKEDEFKDTFSKSRLSIFNYKKWMKKWQAIYK